jgi:hypothetical protein
MMVDVSACVLQAHPKASDFVRGEVLLKWSFSSFHLELLEIIMANQQDNKGGSGTRGGTPEQHAEAGRQSHKNDDNRQSGSGGNTGGSGTRGGTPEQHAEAGRQSHKNDDKK